MYGNTIFENFLARSGQEFTIERNSIVIASLPGLPNHETTTRKAYIGFRPGSDIKSGDWLINSVGERFFVKDVTTDFFMQEPNQLKAYYLTEVEFTEVSTPSSTTIFNIGSATGSIIGTQSSATLNYQTSIQQLREQVADTNSPDKEQLDKLVSMLEMITNGDVPAQKGLLSRFSEVMERNSWITGSIASTLLSWLTTQIH